MGEVKVAMSLFNDSHDDFSSKGVKEIEKPAKRRKRLDLEGLRDCRTRGRRFFRLILQDAMVFASILVTCTLISPVNASELSFDDDMNFTPLTADAEIVSGAQVAEDAFNAAGAVTTANDVSGPNAPEPASQASSTEVQILAKWAQLVPSDFGCSARFCAPAVLVRAIVAPSTRCAGLAHTLGERVPVTMQLRHNPKPEAFPVRVCEAVLELRDVGVGFVDGTHLQWSALLFGGPQSVAIVGDTGCRASEGQDCSSLQTWPFAKVASDAAYLDGDKGPDLVVHVGDFRYAGIDRWEDWWSDFFSPAKPLLEAAPWIIARGNHENCFVGSSGRKGAGWLFFLQPLPYRLSQCAESPDENPINLQPRALDLSSDLRLVVLDTSNSYYRCGKWAANFDLFEPYLRELLNPSRAEANVWLISHYPVWYTEEQTGAKCAAGSRSLTPMRVRLERLLLTAGNRVSAVLSGDIHHFEVVRPLELSSDGAPLGLVPVQFVAGHGGVLIGPQLGSNQEHSCSTGPRFFTKIFSAGSEPSPVTRQHHAHGIAVCEHGFLLAERESQSWLFTLRLARQSADGNDVGCLLSDPRACIGSADAKRLLLDSKNTKPLTDELQ